MEWKIGKSQLGANTFGTSKLPPGISFKPTIPKKPQIILSNYQIRATHPQPGNSVHITTVRGAKNES